MLIGKKWSKVGSDNEESCWTQEQFVLSFTDFTSCGLWGHIILENGGRFDVKVFVMLEVTSSWRMVEGLML